MLAFRLNDDGSTTQQNGLRQDRAATFEGVRASAFRARSRHTVKIGTECLSRELSIGPDGRLRAGELSLQYVVSIARRSSGSGSSLAPRTIMPITRTVRSVIWRPKSSLVGRRNERYKAPFSGIPRCKNGEMTTRMRDLIEAAVLRLNQRQAETSPPTWLPGRGAAPSPL